MNLKRLISWLMALSLIFYVVLCRLNHGRVFPPWKDSYGETIGFLDWWNRDEEAAAPSVPGTSVVPQVPVYGNQTALQYLRLIGRALRDVDEMLGTEESTKYWSLFELNLRVDELFSPAALQELSGMSIFIKGPHSDRVGDRDEVNLNLESRVAFGHYNPRFLQWAHVHLSKLWDDPTFVSATDKLVVKHLSETALLYWDVAIALDKHKTERDILLDEYSQRVAAGIKFEEIQKDLEKYQFYSQFRQRYGGAEVVYFWLRRVEDGTSQQFHQLLTDGLKAYSLLDEERLDKVPEVMAPVPPAPASRRGFFNW